MSMTPVRKRSLDAIDERILRLLRRDARASYRDLGTAVGLSANAVAQRMRRMEASGAIHGYTVLVAADRGPAAGGPTASSPLGFTSVVLVKTTIRADDAEIERRLAGMPSVVEVLDLAGPIDYEIRLRCADQQQLYAAVQEVRALPGITAMETRPVLREVLRR